MRRLALLLASTAALLAPAVAHADKPAQAPGPGAPYRAAVISDHPISYWRLGEQPGATIAADERRHFPGGHLLGIQSTGLAFSRYAYGQWSTLRAPVDRNGWSYVLATYDGDVMDLYVDGALVASTRPDDRDALTRRVCAGRAART